jgi:dihydroorotate dehydrogenase (fumarate)
MDLSTSYLGFTLPHPLMPGASPLSQDLDAVRQLEDAGAAAIVMHSLFEEQITREELGDIYNLEEAAAFSEAQTYFPRPEEFALGPDRYLEQIRRIRAAVRVPVIASLNGVTPHGWLKYAKLMAQAGANALELNIYFLAADPWEPGERVEARVCEVARAVVQAVTIPVAVKLSPFFSSLPNLAKELDALGANGLVLFNRFYQPDIDIETLEIVPRLAFSSSSELLLRLRAVAMLYRRVGASLAVTGGVHTAADAIKAVMAGADAVQMTSALLKNGTRHLGEALSGMKAWMEEHEYESIRQMRGSMSLARCPDPAAFERANYMRILQSWRGQAGG